jgi:phage terminase large subunit GpA-like protein
MSDPAEESSRSSLERADEIMREADDQNLLDEARRAEMLKKIASYRWLLASTHHRLDTGDHLDFERFFYQKEIYQCPSGDMVVLGSTGNGKSEYLLTSAFAMSILGLKVGYIVDTSQKRNDLTLGRVDPVIHSVPLYAGMLKGAQADRNAEVDSARFKHFGDGSILFIGSRAEGDFYSARLDATIVDEHQLCDQNNLTRLFGRRTGSMFRFSIICGNPKSYGTSDNQNLHWHWLKSDQRQWHVPCPYCGIHQVLGWWSHFIEEEKNEFGAILSVRPKDTERDADGVMEIRPVCTNCQRPMRRISTDGKWIASHPGRKKTGFHLSNLFNPLVGTNELFAEYLTGLSDPQKATAFTNDQLGLPGENAGASITAAMLESVSTGRPAGVAPYRVVPADQIVWRDLAAASV